MSISSIVEAFPKLELQADEERSLLSDSGAWPSTKTWIGLLSYWLSKASSVGLISATSNVVGKSKPGMRAGEELMSKFPS
jgi:hypothetical protein